MTRPSLEAPKPLVPSTEIREGLGLPEWLFGALFVLTLMLCVAFIWDLNSNHAETAALFFTHTRVLTWALVAALPALALAATWLLRTNVRERNKFVAQRTAFIAQQQAAFDNARYATLVFDAAGPIALTNSATERLFGHSSAEMLSRDASLLLEIDAGPGVLADRLKVLASELDVGVVRELWARNASGERFPVEITMRFVAGSKGERIGALVRDVSERRAAQEALRESERKFRLLVNGVTDHSLFMIDPAGIVNNWNAGAERLLGYTAQEAIGLSICRFHTEEENAQDIPMQSLAKALAAGKCTMEGWRVRRDGSRFWADTTLHAVRDDDGKLVGFAKITRDISERKRVERLKDDFVSTVNHELRTPLTSIAGSLGLLVGGAGGDLPAGAARLITIAHANCQRLIRLINDMLDVEKIQSGKMRFEMKQLALSDVARRSVELLSNYAENPRVQVELSVDGEPCNVRADFDRLIQVVTNLVSNAIKFSPPDGRVTVSVSREERLVRLCVKDDGPGIPDEFRSRIFTKFAQADSSDTRQKGGTGLGLVIAKEIVDRHGGRLWFESEPGCGASFFVDLPAMDAQSEQRETRAGPRVLICEDDADAATVLAEFLKREGFAVEVVGTIAEARAALSNAGRFQAMLLDLVLPDGDGVILIRELRSSHETQDLPIIVVSAYTERGREALDFNALNVVDWIAKPVDLDSLRRAVRAAVRGVTARRPLILHVEDDQDILRVTASALRSCGEVVSTESLEAARELLARRWPDLVILDIGLGDGSGLELLSELSNRSKTLVPIIIFSAREPDELLVHPVTAVMTKSKSSLVQLAQTVQHLLQQSTVQTRIAI